MNAPCHPQLKAELSEARRKLLQRAEAEIEAGTETGEALLRCYKAIRSAIRQGRRGTFMAIDISSHSGQLLLQLLRGSGIHASFDTIGNLDLTLEN